MASNEKAHRKDGLSYFIPLFRPLKATFALAP